MSKFFSNYADFQRDFSDVLKEKNEEEGDEGRERKYLESETLEEVLIEWRNTSRALSLSNDEHKMVIFTAVLHLCNWFRRADDDDSSNSAFSMVVQGAGGTGKSQTVIRAIRDFLDVCCERTDDEVWRDALLLAAPTNLVARAMGGKTLDKSVWNRRGNSVSDSINAHNLSLIVIDEFSMVSLGWIGKIDKALRDSAEGSNKAEPFGGVSVIFIGDVHQLPPVMGESVYSSNGAGRSLWTGENWQKRLIGTVLMREQYRMVSPLKEIAERFSNGDQTVEDAILLEGCSVRREEGEHLFGLIGEEKCRILSTDNDAKAALNYELSKRLGEKKTMRMWRAEDEHGVDPNEVNKVNEQLEPVQYCWKMMPVICLENYAKSRVVNGSLCFVVKVVFDDEEEPNEEGMVPMPKRIVLLAAETKEEAMEMLQENTLENLLEERIAVCVSPVKRDTRRAFPFAPVYALTLHKAQGMTLDHALLNFSPTAPLPAPLLYTAITRVRQLNQLSFLYPFSASMFMALSFHKSVHMEMERMALQQMGSYDLLMGKIRHFSSEALQDVFDWEWLERFKAKVTEDIEAVKRKREEAAAGGGGRRGRRKGVAEDGVLFQDRFSRNIPIVKDMSLLKPLSLGVKEWKELCVANNCHVALRKAILDDVDIIAWMPVREDMEKWGLEGCMQISRVMMFDEWKEKNKGKWGNEAEKFWTSTVARREKENRWKKIFNTISCGKVIGQIKKKRK